jgi:hypothetical protein
MELKKLEIKISGYKQQLDFIKSDDYRLAFIAGVGSGKTYAGAQKTLDYCIKNPGAWGIITAPQYKILDTATIPTYENVFPSEFIKHVVKKPYQVWTTSNNCKLYFWSTEKPDTIAGAGYAFSHMDEASLSPYLSYVNIKKRLRQKKDDGEEFPYRLFITTTPRQLNWLYQEIVDKIDPIKTIRATTFDNKYINAKEYVERLGLKGKEYEQEVLGEFLSLSGECLFDDQTLSRALNETIAPIDIRNNGYIQIWREPVVGVKYIAGVDCSDEGGEGVNDLIILDPQTGMEMAELYADISADRFASMVYDLCKEYDDPLLGVERNGTAGGMVIQKLLDLKYPNLYRDEKGKPGWYTFPKAIPPKVDRHTMLLEYEEALRLRRTICYSSDAIGEMSTFVRDKDNKYKHREGSRDDRVMSRAICWQMRKHKGYANKATFTSFKRLATSYA